MYVINSSSTIKQESSNSALLPTQLWCVTMTVLVRALEVPMLLEESQLFAQREIFQVIHRATRRPGDLKEAKDQIQKNFIRHVRMASVNVVPHCIPCSSTQSRSSADAARRLLHLSPPISHSCESQRSNSTKTNIHLLPVKAVNTPHPQKSFGNPKHCRNCAPDMDKIPPMYL